MQIAKFEVLGWYFILYRALRATPELWRTRRSELLLFATFVLPLFLAYTLGFSNVGLVLRERLGAVIGVSLLASTSWGLGAAPAGDALATALPLHEGANR